MLGLHQLLAFHALEQRQVAHQVHADQHLGLHGGNRRDEELVARRAGDRAVVGESALVVGAEDEEGGASQDPEGDHAH